MKIRAKVEFPYIKVMGNLKMSENKNCISFRGVNGDGLENEDAKKKPEMFLFQAYGDMIERLQHLKVSKFSEVTIGAYLRKWYSEPENGGIPEEHYSFEIYAIDYLLPRYHKKDKKPKETASPSAADNSKNEPVIKKDPYTVDIEDLEKMFS